MHSMALMRRRTQVCGGPGVQGKFRLSMDQVSNIPGGTPLVGFFLVLKLINSRLVFLSAAFTLARTVVKISLLCRLVFLSAALTRREQWSESCFCAWSKK